jgi:hypothetical protein
MQAAKDLGHVSAAQVSRGLVRLHEKLEAKGRFKSRIVQELGAAITGLGLEELGVSFQNVNNFGRMIISRLREFPNQATRPKAFLAQEYATYDEDDVQMGDKEMQNYEFQDWWAEDEQQIEIQQNFTNEWFANFAKGKGKGKFDRPKGKDKGKPKGSPKGATKGLGKGPKGTPDTQACFNCGAADHWSRECPQPREKTEENGQEPGQYKEVETKKRFEQKKPAKSKFKARLAALLDLFDSEDEYEDESGNVEPPPPNEE